MQERFRHGAASKSEVSLARARLAAARARLYRYEGERNNTLYVLEKLVGKHVHPRSADRLPTRALPKSMKAALATAYKYNPTLVAIEIPSESLSP